VARTGVARWRRGGHPAGRLRLWRLPASRRDRPLQPDHAGRRGVAEGGGLVLGICNGFQVLAEAGLVPGALLRNASLRFAGQEVAIAPERSDTAFTHALDARRPLRMPVAHGEGCYYADDAALDALERDGQVIFRYVDASGANAGPGNPANPNGSLRAIAGVINAAGNVAGLMPHPERAAEAILGSDDGMGILRSLVESAARASGSMRPVEVGAR
jgi:phosphoribosylformylglycinamidine synthase I